MKEFFVLLVAMVIMAATAPVVMVRPNSAVVNCADYSGATW